MSDIMQKGDPHSHDTDRGTVPNPNKRAAFHENLKMRNGINFGYGMHSHLHCKPMTDDTKLCIVLNMHTLVTNISTAQTRKISKRMKAPLITCSIEHAEAPYLIAIFFITELAIQVYYRRTCSQPPGCVITQAAIGTRAYGLKGLHESVYKKSLLS